MTWDPKISQTLIDRFSAGPSAARSREVAALHKAIRSALEISTGKKYDTFLQGSYRNDTAIADINDVDIVALYDPWTNPAIATDWEKLFDNIVAILRRSDLVTGSLAKNDKCVTLTQGSLKADIVPALSSTTYSSTDPVFVFSRRERSARKNYPRTHYKNGVAKHEATKSAYKPTVRMFKRWASQYRSLDAPSFYIECVVQSVASDKFSDYLPLSFASVGAEILNLTRNSVVMSVAGDKDILLSTEWKPSSFEAFQASLAPDVSRMLKAIGATSQLAADSWFKAVFGA